MDPLQGRELIQKLKDGVNSVLVGKERVTDLVITGILSGGHILIEDTPGTGKTLMAKTIAGLIEGDFARIQFTPDLLPADITGLNIYDQGKSSFSFVKGPVFANIILADEINRATPRTQSALLEAMEEGQVTVDNETYTLDKPFMVIATENPIETAGTFPLPEASYDRFVMNLSMGRLTPEEEVRMLNAEGDRSKVVSPVCSCRDIEDLKALAESVYVHDDLKEYMVKIAQKTRDHASIRMGVSPRGTLSLMKAARAYALVNDRDYVLPDDIKDIAGYVFAHRLISYSGRDTGSKQALIKEILNGIEVPSEEWSRR
ncbi:MAG: MoxR family ATPase [Lachnospiraceae bacterium]|nr:MoxR family ATPase [Lachnospiraceae bacterium]